MKRNILTCAICVFLYVMQLPFLGWCIAYTLNPDLSDAVLNVVLINSVVVAIIVLLLLIIGFVAAIKGSWQSFSPLKTTFWVKIALIPFFIINFIIWALFWLGTFNLFLIWAAPFVWVISLFATYLFMLEGGLQNIVYLIKRFLTERQFKYIVFAVLHFIYIADIIAAGLAYYDEKKTKSFCPDAVAAATADSV